MKTLIALLALTFGFNALAADAYEFRNLGFSSDGRYFAFVEYVVHDGAGFPGAYGHVVDVASNSWVRSGSVTIEDESATLDDAISQAVAKLNLSHYGIRASRQGEALWVRANTDLSEDKVANFVRDYIVDGGASSAWPHMRIAVSETPDQSGQHECYGMGNNLLKVTMESEAWSSPLVLQNDARLPKSRACAWNYGIRQVIAYKRSIVTVIRYLTQGFEGPDYNNMVVTGQVL